MDSLTGMDSAAGRSGIVRRSIGGRSAVDPGSIRDQTGSIGIQSGAEQASIGGRTGVDRVTAAYAIHREPPLTNGYN